MPQISDKRLRTHLAYKKQEATIPMELGCGSVTEYWASMHKIQVQSPALEGEKAHSNKKC